MTDMNVCYRCGCDIPKETELTLIVRVAIQLCTGCKKEIGWRIERANGMYQYEMNKRNEDKENI